jgi:hypothetical protein
VVGVCEHVISLHIPVNDVGLSCFGDVPSTQLIQSGKVLRGPCTLGRKAACHIAQMAYLHPFQKSTCAVSTCDAPLVALEHVSPA